VRSSDINFFREIRKNLRIYTERIGESPGPELPSNFLYVLMSKQFQGCRETDNKYFLAVSARPESPDHL
jgi:hypothetical protein